jgi:hypothetical protein
MRPLRSVVLAGLGRGRHFVLDTEQGALWRTSAGRLASAVESDMGRVEVWGSDMASYSPLLELVAGRRAFFSLPVSQW